MSALIDKIKSVRSKVTDADFHLVDGTIKLQNDSDGKGDYIKEWNHPSDVRRVGQCPLGAYPLFFVPQEFQFHDQRYFA